MASPRAARTLPPYRVLLAVAFTACAMALQYALWPYFKPFVGALSYPALLFSVWIGGLWGGLASTALGAVIIAYVFMAPELSWRIANPNNILALAVFCALGVAFSLTDNALRRTRAHLAEQLTGEVAVAQAATIFALARLAESRDGSTGRHLEISQSLCRTLAQGLRDDPAFDEPIDEGFIDCIARVSVLHDVGKVGVPDAVLLKSTPLSDAEREVVRSHAVIGAETLKAVLDTHPGNLMLLMGHDIARHHHERWDGNGYPDGLAGRAIPLSARIMAVADVYEALRSKRCYKPALPHDEAVDIIAAGAGTQFDPAVVRVFLGAAEHLECDWADATAPADQ